MTDMHVNVHLSPADRIVIEGRDHTWMRLGDCVIHASDADLTRIRDTIDRYLTARAFVDTAEAEAA
jgi:hypothetical protein